MLQNELFNKVIQDFDTGYWVLYKASIDWSEQFYTTLGFKNEELVASLDCFLTQLIHKDDVELFRDNFLNYKNSAVGFRQHIKILSKNNDYKLFRCTTVDHLPVDLKSTEKLLFFFELTLQPDNDIKKDNFYYKETAQMTATGSWYVDFIKKKSYWDFETKRILEYSEDYIPTLKDSHLYYAEECQQQAADCFFNCAMAGIPFDTEIKMKTANNRIFWVRAMGKPVYNEKNENIGIRGVFQDIDDSKQKELRLEKSMEIITSQNSRLFNFAHIVSHNLRSHTANLSMILNLMEEVDDINEKLECMDQIKEISKSLQTTITHLNDIVVINTNKTKEKKTVKFQECLDIVTTSINQVISSTNTIIKTNFEAFDSITYIPAYLESILLNLITNAIKYKHPDRDPIIDIKTYNKGDKKILTIADNGRGIDMKLFKDKVFGMYKTFHHNKDAVGIGLFLTKNQVESLNGKIEVESKVGKGTKFSIEF